MSYFFLIPVSIGLGLTGLAAFFWAMRNDQYDDMDGAAERILNAPDIPVATSASRDTPGHYQKRRVLAGRSGFDELQH